MTSTISPLARELRRLRAERGLPIRALAKQAGVSAKTVSLIELGKQHPSALTVAKLARGLDVDTGELLGFEEGAGAPLAAPPHDRTVEPTTRGIEGRRTLLEERRLLSSLHPFSGRVEEQSRYWRQLAGSGRVSLDTLDYATRELEFTARSFGALVDAAIAERWSGAELRLLGRVYESVAGPYRDAWSALMTTWAEGATDTQGSRRLRLVADADEAMRAVEEAGEAVRRVA